MVPARTPGRFLTAALLVSILSVSTLAADLQPATVAAFDRYVRLTESRMNAPGPFLRVDALPAAQRRERLEELERDGLVIERLTTRDGQRPIDVPDGLIHRPVGLMHIRGATVNRVVALLQDYDAHAEIYKPVVARSKLRSREGDTFRVYLRFVMSKVITVVVNGEHEARFRRVGPDRVESAIRSTRIAEVVDPDTPMEHEKPVGHDGGYLWRLNTYWRFL